MILAIHNLITDSRFDFDTVWQGGPTYSSNNPFSDTRALLLPSGQNKVITNPQVPKPISGHVYYGRRMIRSDGLNPANTESYCGWTRNFILSEDTLLAYNSGNFSVWTRQSKIIHPVLVDASATYTWAVNCGSDPNNVYIDDFVLIDLTQDFGAGLEPTKDWCDINFAALFNSTQVERRAIEFIDIKNFSVKPSILNVGETFKISGFATYAVNYHLPAPVAANELMAGEY